MSSSPQSRAQKHGHMAAVGDSGVCRSGARRKVKVAQRGGASPYGKTMMALGRLWRLLTTARRTASASWQYSSNHWPERGFLGHSRQFSTLLFRFHFARIMLTWTLSCDPSPQDIQGGPPQDKQPADLVGFLAPPVRSGLSQLRLTREASELK